MEIDTPDLRLHFIALPDTVFFGPPYIEWYFGTSLMEVENLSNDTIDRFRLECNWIPFIGFCDNYKQAWEFDDIVLLPGESREFIIDPFIANMGIGYHSPFCFWIESANGFPDPNPDNNYACDAAQIVTGIHDLQLQPFAIFPNPATHQFTISQSGNAISPLAGILVDAFGQMIMSFEVSDAITVIPLPEIPDGFYLIQLQDDRGHREVRKLIIQQ
jgi:hypothetical protein